MPIYDFACNVHGNWDGEVEAKNKEEALEKANIELEIEGLHADGDIEITRRPKNE